jgi:hypothetical protein
VSFEADGTAAMPAGDGYTKGPWQLAVRAASHASVWLLILSSCICALARGWLPVSDDAAISARAFQSLSAHPPLVGMLSTAGDAIGVHLYSPGPLQFWLLAVPVRVDPSHGAFWGSALIAGIALSLAIEAIWSTGVWYACAFVSVAVADLCWATPSVFNDLAWNAYFPVPLLLASLGIGWAVARGRLGWWPVLVVCASIAGQSHLFFLLPSVAVVVVAPAMGIANLGRPQRWRWLVAGIAAGALCWLAPLAQTVGSNGNLSNLVSSGSSRATFGIRFGLGMIAHAASLDPLILRQISTSLGGVISPTTSGSAAMGLAVVIVLLALTVAALRLKRASLAGLSALTLALCTAIAVNFALVPLDNFISLGYLSVSVWVVSLALWATVLTAVADVVLAARDRVLTRRRSASLTEQSHEVDGLSAGGPHELTLPQAVPHATATVGAVTVLVVLALATIGGAIPHLAHGPAAGSVIWSSTETSQIVNVTNAVEGATHPGPVAFVVLSHFALPYAEPGIEEGVAWRLEADGWHPGLFSFEQTFTGLVLPDHSEFQFVTVLLNGTHVESAHTVKCRSFVYGACP